MSKPTVFEKLGASAPVNKSAAMTVSGRGDHYDWRPPAEHSHWPDAPAFRTPVYPEINLVGQRCGRLTVIGLLVEPKPRKKPARWVVRCQCGNFEGRSAKALLNPANSTDRCMVCRKTAYMRDHKDIGARSLGDK